jgi:septal ring factor EnvC (AmiA/AmiB activator)
MNERLEKELESQTHQHRIRSEVLRERSRVLDQHVASLKKEARVRASQQRKELKSAKMHELKAIENALREDNEKMLMGLE